MMSLVTVMTHLLRTCVVLEKWLQTIEAQSLLFGVIKTLLWLQFEKFVTLKQPV
jgi:hypothetical protein